MKKMILLVMVVFILSGCRYLTKDFKAYDENNFQEYIDKMSAGLKEEIKPTVYIDLRPLGNESNENGKDYANGHIEYFINYDYKLIGKDQFLKTLEQYYSKTHYFFLIDADGILTSEVAQVMKDNGYRHLFYYTKGYENIMALAEGQLRTQTGDCGC